VVHGFLLIVLEALNGAHTSAQSRSKWTPRWPLHESYSVEPMFNGMKCSMVSPWVLP